MATGGRDPSVAREGLVHAERALRLAPNDPVVLGHLALPMGYCGEWKRALQYAQRAVDLNPNLYIARGALGQLCLRFGRPDDAIANFEAAQEIAPRGYLGFIVIGMTGLAHFQAGRYEQALQVTEQALIINPGFVFALRDKAVFCDLLGRHDEAAASLQRLRAMAPTLTIDDLETATRTSFLPPETAEQLNGVFRRLWQLVPVDPPAR
jgi:tetratricopeptide (TPR) repeat protein